MRLACCFLRPIALGVWGGYFLCSLPLPHSFSLSPLIPSILLFFNGSSCIRFVETENKCGLSHGDTFIHIFFHSSDTIESSLPNRLPKIHLVPPLSFTFCPWTRPFTFSPLYLGMVFIAQTRKFRLKCTYLRESQFFDLESFVLRVKNCC